MLSCPPFARYSTVSPGPVGTFWCELAFRRRLDLELIRAFRQLCSWSGPQADSVALPTLEAESVLGLCSGRTQYSAQSPQRTAGERNTTPLSHLADVPVLLYSLPHFFPPSSLSFSLAQYLTHVYTNGPVGSVAVCVRCGREAVYCVQASRRSKERERKRWKGCRRWRKTKINTQENIASERERQMERN